MTVIDTGTTDSNGKVELETGTLSTAGTKNYVVKHENQSYNVSVDVVNVGKIELSSSDEFIYDGGTAVIYAKVYDNSNNLVEGIPVEMLDKELVTDTNGVCSASYTGDGRGGEVTITATCGSVSKSISISDVVQYWSRTQNKKYNVMYTTRGDITITELSKGIKLASAPNSFGEITFLGFLGGNQFIDYEFSFNVKSFTPLEQPTILISYLKVNVADITSNVSNGGAVVVKCEGGVRTVKVDGVTVSTKSINEESVSTPHVFFIPQITLVGEVLLDNIKLMEL